MADFKQVSYLIKKRLEDQKPYIEEGQTVVYNMATK